MRIFLCWLINVCDWVGELSIFYMFIAIQGNSFEFNEQYAFLYKYFPVDGHFAILGGILAIIPALVTAIYAAINYDLVLSWAVIRWMSPLNIFTSIVFYFFKTLFLMGAVWAALFTYLTFKFFPNADLSWTTSFLKSIWNILF